MAQSQQHSLTDAIVDISPAESIELAKLFANPLIIKYFRAVGMNAVFEQAAYPYDKMSEKDFNFLLTMAYQKGIQNMADTVLNYTPIKESNNVTST